MKCSELMPWLQTSGVSANGAAAEVMQFDCLGEKVRPGTFGKLKVGYRECPKSPSVNKKTQFAATPLALTPSVPFRTPSLLPRAPSRAVRKAATMRRSTSLESFRSWLYNLSLFVVCLVLS